MPINAQSVRKFIRHYVPFSQAAYASIQKGRRQWRRLKLSLKNRRDIFTNYYHINQWADDDSRSGQGSNMEQTRRVREVLSELFKKYDIKTFVDVPCGDFFWMKHVEMAGVDYVGCDIVVPMIEANTHAYGNSSRRFQVLDLCAEAPPTGDMIFCRDALVHLSVKDITAALSNIKLSGSGYLLTTTFPEINVNEDIATGMWRPINLCKPPFNLPPPLQIFDEGFRARGEQYKDKSLGLWRIADLS